MAEVFGVVAGAVQLADVALRASREAYGFLAAVKDANKDIKALRDTLRDVESNVRSLRRYVAEFQKSKCAIEEFEVLSETITKSFGGFHDDILALKQILPPKPSPSLAEKTKWTYKQRRIKEITGRLRDRKVDLTTALSITGRLHDLRLREDAATIMRQQKISTTAIDQQVEKIDKNTKAFEQSHAELIEHTRKISAQLETLRNASKSNLLRQRRQFQDIRVIKQSLRNLSTLDGTSLNSSIYKPTPIQNRHNLRPIETTVSVEPDYEAAIGEIHNTTTFSASHTDLAARIVRNELRSTLGSMIEQAHITSESRYEVITKKMDALIEQISSGFSQAISGNESIPSNPDSQNSKNDRNLGHEQQLLKQTELGPKLNEYGAHATTCKYRQTWYRSWRIGKLLVQITRTTRRLDATFIANSDLTINVQFWPNHTFIQVPSVALSYSTMPNQEGFYYLAPMISVIPILSLKHDVWNVIRRDDITQLRKMLLTGEIHLKSQDNQGATLLHHAMQSASLQTSQFLATQGLSWYQPTHNNLTPLDYALIPVFTCDVPNKDRISILQAAPGLNADLDKLLWHNMDTASDITTDHAKPERDVTQICEYIVQNSGDGWHHCCYILIATWSYPTSYGLVLINSMLEKGLSPNQTIIFDAEVRFTLLNWALMTMMEFKRDSQDPPGFFSRVGDPGDTFHGSVTLWCIVTALIQGGASIYDIEPSSFDDPDSWIDLWTIRDWVEMGDIQYEWEMALRECDLDPDDVWLEDVRQLKQAFRFRSANRTGFDETTLELPSFSGLRCRRCHKKVCKSDSIHSGISHEDRLRG